MPFQMEWNPKTPLQWDWDNLAMFCGKESEISRSAQQPEWTIEAGGGGIGNVPVYSSTGGGNCSGSELGNGSSGSSISNSQAAQGFSKNPIKNKESSVRVDDARASPVVAATTGPKEPLIGLKLGKRTYFEDFCAGSNIKNSSPASASLTPSTALVKKSRVSSQQRMQSFHCQVEGCNTDLTSAKDYHRKHRVCESHSKCPKVIVAGQERRFCQQCSRFHDLSEFDQKKRSCRRRLSDHNARRRKPQPETISFNSSSFYDYGQQMSFLLNRAPFGNMRPTASSSSCGFKLSQAKESWIKSPKLGGVEGQLHYPSTEQSHTFSTAEVLNQGLEASVAASNLDGAPDLRRALSLLSSESWGSAVPGSTPVQYASHASGARPAVHTLSPTAEYWQDEHHLAQQARVLSFGLHNNGSQFQEFQLLKAPYETTFFESGQMH